MSNISDEDMRFLLRELERGFRAYLTVLHLNVVLAARPPSSEAATDNIIRKAEATVKILYPTIEYFDYDEEEE